MNIIHIVEPFSGGVYDFVRDLCEGMSDGQHTIIYANRPDTPEYFYKDFSEQTSFIKWKHVAREINPGYDLIALLELINILKLQETVSVIHLHSSKAGFLGRIAAKWLGLSDNVVYTPHGVSFLRKDVSPLKHKLFIWLERIGSWFGGNTIACSKSEMGQFHQHRLPARYINNGITCNKRIVSYADGEELCIGTVGRITYQKNPRLFNQIARHFINKPSVRFLWIGDGELGNELDSPNMHVTGWLSRAEVEKKLDCVDIYLSTSLWEGLPLSVLQAMCAGRSLLLSDCVGNRDLVTDSYNGKIFRSYNEALEGLDYMISEKKLLSEYGLNSKKLYEQNFQLGKMINAYRMLYRTVQKN